MLWLKNGEDDGRTFQAEKDICKNPESEDTSRGNSLRWCALASCQNVDRLKGLNMMLEFFPQRDDR